MSGPDASPADHHEPEHYEIRLKGHLDTRWSDWIAGMNLTHQSDGITVLSGPLDDQAALHGVLRKVRDLGLPIVSVNHVELEQPDGPSIEDQ